MIDGVTAVLVFAAAVIALRRMLLRRERAGHRDKEGHGSAQYPRQGITYRPLEVPLKPPFG